jgi:MerR family mercuric resistance operon transcriptional regulator
MQIGEAAQALGIPVSAIRFYERKDIVGPFPRSQGIRHIGKAHFSQLQFLKMAQSAGFSLSEIGTVLDLIENKGTWHTHLAEMARIKKADVIQKMAQLGQVLAFLSKMEDCNCETVEVCLNSSCTK